MKQLLTFLLSASICAAQFPWPGPGRVPAVTGSTNGAHTYWRMLISASGTTVAALGELQYYDSTGTLLSTGGTASASSAQGGFGASRAFDGDKALSWGSSGDPNSTPEWLCYQMASSVSVASILVFGDAGLDSQSPTAFKIQYSDTSCSSGMTDATGVTFSGLTWDVDNRAKGFAVDVPATGKYVNYRIHITSTQNGNPCLGEFTMESTVSGSNAATGGGCFATDHFSGSFGCTQALDGDTSTLWSSSGSAPKDIGYSFTMPLTIVEFKIKARDDAPTFSPSAGTVQGSNDFSTWTSVYTFSAATWTTAGQTQTFVF